MRLNESTQFLDLLQCTRAGDLEKVSSLVENFNVELNCVDKYDYSPLILASLCGHITIVSYLLEHGAILERDTFDGARCLYGALNDEIRNLLLKYDASTAVDILQPFAAHLSALRRGNLPLSTADITFKTNATSYSSHKFLLKARSPYFREKLESNPEWQTRQEIVLPEDYSVSCFDQILKWLYVDNIDLEVAEDELRNLLTLAQRLQIPAITDFFLEESSSKKERLQAQSRLAQEDLERYVAAEIIQKAWKIDQPLARAGEEARTRLNTDRSICADALLGIPLADEVTLVYAVSKSMLIKSEFYLTALTSGFAESSTEIPYFTLDTSQAIAEIVLRFLYVDKVDIPRALALDTLETAAYLLLSKDRSLKSLAAIVVTNDDKSLPLGTDVYAILRMAWHSETPRLEQYAAKYIAKHLDEFLYQDAFKEIIEESASRIANRQETDTIELVDDIRFYLSQAYGIYLEMNTAEEQKAGESVKEDLWVPLTVYELQYNEQLAKLDDVLASLSLDA